MINHGKFKEQAEFIKFAGKTSGMEGSWVEKCIKPDVFNKVNKFPDKKLFIFA